MATGYNERTSIQSIKTIFFLLGLFFSSATVLVLFFRPTDIYPMGQLNPESYHLMAGCTSMMMLIFGLICYFSTFKYRSYPVHEEVGGILSKFNPKDSLLDIVSALKHKNYRVIVIGYLLTNTSAILISTIGLHIYTYTFLMNSDEIAVIVGTMFIVSIVGQPIWLAISKRIDKRPAVILGLLISIGGAVLFMFFVLRRNIIIEEYRYLTIFSTVIGFGTAGLFSIPLSMISDTTDEDELKSGERREGLYFGIVTFGYKLSQAIAVLVLGVVLDVINFNPDLAVQTERVSTTIGMILPIGSIIGFAWAIYIYSGYLLDYSKTKGIQDELHNRKG